jgi:glycosyltransferase involved in cell wall biosynthesis
LLGVLDVFCLVSYREGMPLSLIEAMAAGLPAVGTDVAGIRDVIEPDGNGQLVPPDDVPALAAALERLIDDASLRRDMGRTARQLAVEKYSLKRCVYETQRAFISLVPDRPSAERVGHSTVA